MSFNEAGVTTTGRLLANLLMSLSFLVPMALLSLTAVDRVIGIGVVLVLCLVFNLLMLVLGPEKEEHQWLLILAYVAIMGGFLANMKD